jgi:iron uptake system component EfeO
MGETPDMSTKRHRGAAAVTVAMAALAPLALAACGSDDDSSGTKTLGYTITDAGCIPAERTIQAGSYTFDVTNDGSRVSEFELLSGDQIAGEKEGLTDGKNGSFSLDLAPGEYETFCPGAETAKGKLTVTRASSGETASGESAGGAAAVAAYRRYVEENTAELVRATRVFTGAVAAGDVGAAKAAYTAARIPYEKIEPVAESFGDLDPEIDAREGDVPAKQWGGFHKVEQALYVANTAAGMAPVAKKLQSDVQLLDRKVQTIELQPAQIANGATELLNEVSASKITGEEERYSRTDLVDFQANVDGSRAAFEAVKPILEDTDPELVKAISHEFDAVDTALDPYRAGDGFVPYTDLTEADKRKLSQAIDALAEPLSQAPAKVAGQ